MCPKLFFVPFSQKKNKFIIHLFTILAHYLSQQSFMFPIDLKIDQKTIGMQEVNHLLTITCEMDQNLWFCNIRSDMSAFYMGSVTLTDVNCL